jgi:hypothetical protein
MFAAAWKRRSKLMTQSVESSQTDFGAFVDSVSSMIGLSIPAASKPVVAANLEVASRMAALLENFELDEREEPAPVYRP